MDGITGLTAADETPETPAKVPDEVLKDPVLLTWLREAGYRVGANICS
jgi:hypothetical protein